MKLPKTKSHLERKLESISEQKKEDLAREKRNFGRIRHPEEQVSTKKNMWKSWSKIRYTSPEFRAGYDEIDWSR